MLPHFSEARNGATRVTDRTWKASGFIALWEFSRARGGKGGVKRASAALTVGSVFVCMILALGRHNLATPIPFWLLMPGILTGALVPGSGFNPEGDTHPWGLASTLVVFAVNVGIYSGLAYLALGLFGWPRKTPK
jgi:hypothetical protein